MKLGGADNAFDAIVNTIKHTADNTTLPVRRQFCQTRSVLTLHDLILSLLTELFTFHTRGCVQTFRSLVQQHQRAHNHEPGLFVEPYSTGNRPEPETGLHESPLRH